MDGVRPLSTLVDDAFRASLDGEALRVGDDIWQIAVHSAQIGRRRLSVQLRADGPALWFLTLSLPPFSNRVGLLSVVAKFLRQPEHDHHDVVAGIRATSGQRLDRFPPLYRE
jgi:hypothetical protein